MDYQEFSWRFDTLYNNITSNQAPGLTEAEKSMFLTKGQDEVIKNYFNPKSNKLQEGFDGSQKRQIDFSSITSVDTVLNTSSAQFDTRGNSVCIVLPSDIWMIVNEKAIVLDEDDTEKERVIKAISFEEYDRYMSKPFKRPLKQQAWRLIYNDGSNKCDIIIGPGEAFSEYHVRYIRRPKPIIIGNMDDLTLNGYSWGGTTTPLSPVAGKIYGDKCCELDPILHEEILQRAVELAKVAWTATGQDNTNAMIQAGQRSE